MNLKKRIEKCQKYSGKPDLPWHVSRVFPNIDIGCTGIAFDMDGDYVTIDEALEALAYLRIQLEGEDDY